MLRKILILFTIISFVFTEDCVRYTFDDGYEELFTNERRVCASPGLTDWNLIDYKDVWVNSQHQNSTKFISPQEIPSCTSSFSFQMTAGGTVEVIIFMELVENADQVSAFAYEEVNNGNDAVVGTAGTSPLEPNFARGWQTLRFTLRGTGTYDGYITFMGMALSTSVVIVDSFRYIPPGMASSECEIYEQESTYTADELEESETDDTFWASLNIKIIVLASVLSIILLSVVSYCCRKSKVAVKVAA